MGINKEKLGEWLGEEGSENNHVLSEFCYSFHFQGQTLENALRIFCSKIKIPYDNHKIDRIMDSFATSYFSMNKGSFSSADTIHKISFSCIMLNRDCHPSTNNNKSNGSGGASSMNTFTTTVNKKTSEEAFIANHRGIDSGQDLSREFLQTLYRSISENEITTPLEQNNDSVVLFTNPDKHGWLKKQGGRHKGWAKRYFLLSDATLFYFENEGDIDPKGFFPLENLTCNILPNNKKQVILLPKVGDVVNSAKFDNNGEMVIGNHKTLILTATTENEASEWAAFLGKN